LAYTEEAKAPELSGLDSVINASIQNHEIPGAVLLVGHHGRVIYRKAYGQRSLEPARSAMTVDTIFDIASLTKVVATNTAIMQLVDQGKVRLNDPVVKYIPEFGQNGKADITVRDLLTQDGT
jgi:CubicO group peptidase (beta-lactamase class C family)